MTAIPATSPDWASAEPEIGQPAPAFALPSVQGEVVELESFRGRANVILWFSRGFTCTFCRGHMADMAGSYQAMLDQAIQVIQIAPNLAETARIYLDRSVPPFPFICDPDKRLYAVYGLGDRGALEATRNTVVSFGTAFITGDGVETVRASWTDVMNRNFLRRLHHHALTAVEQGLFIVDRDGVIRYRLTISAVDHIPPAQELLDVTRSLCR